MNLIIYHLLLCLATPKLYNYIYLIYLHVYYIYDYIICIYIYYVWLVLHIIVAIIIRLFSSLYSYTIKYTLSFQRFESFLLWCQRNRILTSSHRGFSNTSFPHAKCIHCKRAEKFNKPKKPQWQILGMMIAFQSSSHHTCHLAKSIHVFETNKLPKWLQKHLQKVDGLSIFDAPLFFPNLFHHPWRIHGTDIIFTYVYLY